MKYPVLAQMRRPLVSIKRSVGLAILLLACRSLAFSQIQEGQVEPISSALRAGEFDKAVELSRVALKASPSNAQLWTLQGIAYAGKGDGKEALTSFQRALKISPNNLAALAGAAQIEYQEGNQSAMPLLNHLLQLRPGDPTAHAMLAVLEYPDAHVTVRSSLMEPDGGTRRHSRRRSRLLFRDPGRFSWRNAGRGPALELGRPFRLRRRRTAAGSPRGAA